MLFIGKFPQDDWTRVGKYHEGELLKLKIELLVLSEQNFQAVINGVACNALFLLSVMYVRKTAMDCHNTGHLLTHRLKSIQGISH